MANFESKLSINIKLSSLVFIGMIIQIIATQGILTYNLFDRIGLWQLKIALHPIGIILVVIPLMIKLIKNKQSFINIESLLLFSYLIIQYFIFLSVGEISFISFLYSLREVVVLFFLMSAYSYFSFTKIQFDFVVRLLIILVVLNILFVCLNFYIGNEKYMLLMTGRFFYPLDPLLNFKISSFLGLAIRSPGLIGESAAVGYFGVFSFIFIFNSKRRKYSWLALLLVFLSLTRSAYVVLFVFLFLKIISKKKYLRYLFFISPLLILVFYYVLNSGILSITSFFMRIDNWQNKINLKSNLLFGGNLNNIGKAATHNVGFAATMDSYWLYIYYGFGMIGIVLILYFLIKKVGYTRDNIFFLLGISIGGFFITYTQSIPFVVFFPLIVIKEWWKKGAINTVTYLK